MSGVEVTDAGIGPAVSVNAPHDPVELDRWIGFRLRRIAQLKEEIERNHAIAQAEIDRYTTWRDDQNRSLLSSVHYLEDQIRMASLAYDFGTKKSRTLAEGTFGYQQTGGSVKITNMTAAVVWAKQHGYEDSIKETIGVKPIKEYIESTGEAPEFVEVEPKVDAFYVKVGNV
jgi:phage host-nuclease inhibitor protein Gam